MGDSAWQAEHIIQYLKALAQSSFPSHYFWDTVRNIGKSAVSDLLRKHDSFTRSCLELGLLGRNGVTTCVVVLLSVLCLVTLRNAGRAELLPTTTGAASGTSTMSNNTPKSPTTWA
jgi:hypothetical protein